MMSKGLREIVLDRLWLFCIVETLGSHVHVDVAPYNSPHQWSITIIMMELGLGRNESFENVAER
jgi:hypothetical protein